MFTQSRCFPPSDHYYFYNALVISATTVFYFYITERYSIVKVPFTQIISILSRGSVQNGSHKTTFLKNFLKRTQTDPHLTIIWYRL